MVEGARELSGASFIRALIPFMRAPPLRPNHLPKAPRPTTITLGIRFQSMNLQGSVGGVGRGGREHKR